MANDQQDNVAAPKASTPNGLHPWEIDLSKITDEKDLTEAKKVIREWLTTLQKDISDLLTKNGVKTFELCFWQSNIDSPILVSKGSNYACAKLAATASAQLKKRVLEEIDPNDQRDL